MKLPIMQIPCNNCPFRKDSLEGWLGSERMTEILEADSFVCHKSTKNDIEGSENKKRKQCVGFMLLKDTESQAVKYAELLEIDLGLKGKDLIFDSKEDCINHHKN